MCNASDLPEILMETEPLRAWLRTIATKGMHKVVALGCQMRVSLVRHRPAVPRTVPTSSLVGRYETAHDRRAPIPSEACTIGGSPECLTPALEGLCKPQSRSLQDAGLKRVAPRAALPPCVCAKTIPRWQPAPRQGA